MHLFKCVPQAVVFLVPTSALALHSQAFSTYLWEVQPVWNSQ